MGLSCTTRCLNIWETWEVLKLRDREGAVIGARQIFTTYSCRAQNDQLYVTASLRINSFLDQLSHRRTQGIDNGGGVSDLAASGAGLNALKPHQVYKTLRTIVLVQWKNNCCVIVWHSYFREHAYFCLYTLIYTELKYMLNKYWIDKMKTTFITFIKLIFNQSIEYI